MTGIRTRTVGALSVAIPLEFWDSLPREDMERMCITSVMPPPQVARLCRLLGIVRIPQGEVRVVLCAEDFEEAFGNLKPVKWRRIKSKKPITVNGVTFYAWRHKYRGHVYTVWRNADDTLNVEEAERGTFTAWRTDHGILCTDDTGKWRRFPSLIAAMQELTKDRVQ